MLCGRTGLVGLFVAMHAHLFFSCLTGMSVCGLGLRLCGLGAQYRVESATDVLTEAVLAVHTHASTHTNLFSCAPSTYGRAGVHHACQAALRRGAAAGPEIAHRKALCDVCFAHCGLTNV